MGSRDYTAKYIIFRFNVCVYRYTFYDNLSRVA